MRLPRLYLPQDLADGQSLQLASGHSHYLCRVLRLKTGQPLELFNGNDRCWPATLLRADPRAAELQLGESRPCESESPLDITLVQALARGERMDYALQKSCELGARRIVLLHTQRSEVKLEGKRLDNRLRHWQEVLIHAAQQSGRCRVPELEPPQSLSEWLARRDAKALALMMHPQAEALSTARIRQVPAIEILVGPEGGFSNEEVDMLQAAGIQAVRFGPRILRTETAGPALIAVLQALAGDWLA